MAVVPARAVLAGQELVGPGRSWGNWALSDTIGTIMLGAVQLTNSVPMNGCAIVRYIVVNDDPEGITPLCEDTA